MGGIIILLSILLGLSLYTFNPSVDSNIFESIRGTIASHNYTQILNIKVSNSGGVVGAFFAWLIIFLFGKIGFLLPPLLLVIGIIVYTGEGKWHLPGKVKLGFSAIFLIAVLFTIDKAGSGYLPLKGFNMGGAAAYITAKIIKLLIGTLGAYLITSIALLSVIVVLSPSTTKRGLAAAAMLAERILKSIVSVVLYPFRKDKREQRRKPEKQKGKIKIVKTKTIKEGKNPIQEMRTEKPVRVNIKRDIPEVEVSEGSETPFHQQAEGEYIFPEISFLEKGDPSKEIESDEIIKERAESLKKALNTFGVRINEESVESYPGPVITRYEFQPAPGIKVSQIINLADDLALAMRAKSIRVIAPIPGKGAVGVEVPNKNPHIVRIAELLKSPQFRSEKYEIPLALGKDTGGIPFIADLSKMPHLLIAGATGSGKSVCLNSIITSILYRLHPDKIRFIFIDPKRLELSVYSGIPHLERPVVTKPRQAERVLAGVVEEMDNRYSKLAEASVRSIQDFNKKVPEQEWLPYIVIIIDELADLIVGSSNKIELMITRLAQMARAVGIHLILATQRPSVDVITGLIKANFSSRIAFQVASKVDSRTILDSNGAEKLLGNGDMLLMLTGRQELVRLHGSYISSEETARIVEFLRGKEYSPKPVDTLKDVSGKKSKLFLNASDELFRQAAETVVLHKQGSVSLLQRRLGVGYQRAARLIDQLEEAGIVGPYDGSKARKVLVNEQYLQTLFSEKSGSHN